MPIVRTWPYRSISRSSSPKYSVGGSSEKNNSARPNWSLHITACFGGAATIWTNPLPLLLRADCAWLLPPSRYSQFRNAVNFTPRLLQNSRCVRPDPSNSPTIPDQYSRPRRTCRFCLFTLRVSPLPRPMATRRRLNGYYGSDILINELR